MKKNKILLTLAMFATITLAACGKKNVTTENKTTTDSNNNVVVKDHDRGSEDNSLPKIDLPDVIIKDNNNLSFEATDESISLGSGDYVETNAGSGSSETVEGAKFVSATVNIGYEFLGWYCGDKLVSTELKYKCKAGEENIAAKFRLKEGFEYLEFTSNEEECIVTGLKEDYPIDLVIPEGVTEISENAFEETNLVNVTLPETLETLGTRAFYDCYELRSLTFKAIPENMGDEIAEYTNLACVFIPDDFNYTDNMNNALEVYVSYYIKSTDSNYYVKDNLVFRYKNNEWCLAAYIGSEEEVELPGANDVISEYFIEDYAFYRTGVKKVKLSSVIKSIGSEAFYQCYDLEDIDLGSSVTSIKSYAFYECESLKEIVIPKSITSIEYCAFYDCDNLFYIYNYSDLEFEKGEDSYGYIAYNALEIVTGKEEDPTYKTNDDFVYTVDGNNVTLKAYIGNSKDIVIPTFDGKKIIIGESLFYNNQVIETVTFNDDCIEIESSAFYSCDNLKKVNTAGVIDIDSYAFDDCDYLEEAILPNVDYIASRAFNCCYKLKTVECPNLTYLSDYVFYYCQELESINLEKVEGIGNNAFYYCISLKEAIMNEATSIGESAFYECIKLEKAIMPKATSLGAYAFQDCYRLRTVDISSVSSIGNLAFYANYSLLTITLPSTLTSISGSYTFEKCYCLVEIVNNSTLNLNSGTGYLTSYAKSIITDPADSILTYENNLITYINDDNETVLIGIIDRSVKKLVIPSSVDIVRANALYGCDVLEDLEFNQAPEGDYTGYLGFYFGAYYQYSNYAYSHNDEFVPKTLKTVRYSGNNTAIPRYALYSCYYVENVYIGKNITAINQSAFYSNHFKNIYFDGTIEDWCNINFITEDRNPLYYGGKIHFKNGDSYSELNVVEVPDTISSIGNYQFYGFNMEKVILPEGITSIGDYAFYNCYNLKNIVIKEGLESIGERAFSNSLLKGIVLPNSLETIEGYAFANCRNLISAKLGNSVTSIGDYAFSGCSLLYNFNAPDTLASLGEGVFMGCETLEEITLEDTAVTQLKDYLFANCVNLESFGFPTGLTSIETTTFQNCDKLVFRTYKNGCYFGTEDNPYRWLIKARAKTILECIVHPDCEKIYDGAFSGCKNLRKIVIPATCICGTCLKGLTNVEYVEAPYTGTDTFGQTLFGIANANLTSIKTIIINGGAIADNAFTGLSDDVELTITGDFTSIGAYALKGRKIVSFIATSSLKTIGNYAFQNCTLLEEVDLGTVESIGTGAFKGCTALVNLTLSSSSKFTVISESAFENCSSLSAIKIDTNLKEIGDYAFKNSGLATVTTTTPNLATMFLDVTKLGKESFCGCKLTKLKYVESTIKNIGANAFKDCLELTTVEDYYVSFVGTGMFEGCTALTKFSSTSNTATLNNKAFYGCSSLSNLTIRYVSYIGEYALAGTAITSFKQGETFGSSATENSRILKVKSYAFYNCKELTTVYLYSNEIVFVFTESYSTYTATNVFEGCSNLVNVTLPSNMTTINAYTFKDCTSLETFNFASVTSIKEYAFSNTGFTELTLPSNITSLGNYVFSGCASLETVTMERKLVVGLFKDCTALTDITLSGLDNSVASYAFSGCTALTSFTLTSGMEFIYDNAFENSGLTSIDLEGSVTTIDNYAFRGSKLATLVIPSNITSIGTYAFSDTQLVEVVIPSTVTTLSNYAFTGNTLLKKVTINTNASQSSLFADCSALEEAIFSEGVTTVNNEMFENCTSLNTVIFPASLTSIGSQAFNNCTGLEEITLPKALANISSNSNYPSYYNSFYDCTNLKTVNNYSDLEITAGSSDFGYVAYYATKVNSTFSNYTPIVVDDFVFAVIDDKAYLMGYNGIGRALELPESFTYNEETYNEYDIYYNAFFNHDLLSITIPSSVKAIYDYAFGGCYKLVEIYNLSSIDMTIGANDNGGISQYALVIHTSKTEPSILLIEDGFVLGYYEEEGQKIGKIIGYAGTETYITLPSSFTLNEEEISIKEIDAEAFMGLGIESVTIPSGITTIGKDAFKNCTLLQIIEAANTVTEFDGNPFSGCNQVKKATIPTWMIKYVNYRDNNNTALMELIINGGDTIETRALEDLGNLYKVTLGSSVKTIKEYSFSDCSKLEIINLDNVETIKSFAFDHCSSLKTIILPDGITAESQAFNYCTSLEYVVMPKNWANINSNAFRESCASYEDEMKILCNGEESDFTGLKIAIGYSSYYGYTYANMYYYSETELSGNYWHYDSNNNPINYKYEKALVKLQLLATKMREYLDNALTAIANEEEYEYLGTDDTKSICPYNKDYYIRSDALLYILEQESDTESLAILTNISGKLEIYYNVSQNHYYYNISSSTTIDGYLVQTVTDKDRYVLRKY